MPVTSSFFDNVAILTWDYCGTALVLALLFQVFVPRERRWLGTWIAIYGLALCGLMLGVWCNNIVMYVNDGHMPVRGLSEMDWVIRRHFGDHLHAPLNESTRLKWLADLFQLPRWVPARVRNEYGIFSLGDVMLWTSTLLQRLVLVPALIALFWAWLRNVTSRS